MAFINYGEDYSQLNDEQMITDILVTHNKITADIRDILWKKKIIESNNSTHISIFELSTIFTDACLHDFFNRDKSLINLDDDYCAACQAYENFMIPDISNRIFIKDSEYLHRRIQDKYRQYSHAVDKWYDFFMLPLEEKLKLLCPNKQI